MAGPPELGLERHLGEGGGITSRQWLKSPIYGVQLMKKCLIAVAYETPPADCYVIVL
jgi:hypothetical protein